MNAELGLHYILCNNPTFLAHVGTTASNARVYYDVATQGAEAPYTIVSEDGVDPNSTKDGKSDYDFDFIKVTHYAKDRLKVSSMARDARAAIDRAVNGVYQTIIIESAEFETQNSDVEQNDDNILHKKEQVYKVHVRV